jgi:hypothetical protein
MNTKRPAPPTPRGGYSRDLDLPRPSDGPFGNLAGLHVLRHLRRHLAHLGMEPVLIDRTSCDTLEAILPWGYRMDANDHPLSSYRRASARYEIVHALEHEPNSVPVLGMQGSQCLGWNRVSWSGVSVSQHLRPGQLFCFVAEMARLPRRNGPTLQHRFHLAEWQPPFPTHSLVTWGNNARLRQGPQEIQWREMAAYLFYTGGTLNKSPEDGRRYREWYARAEAAARPCHAAERIAR